MWTLGDVKHDNEIIKQSKLSRRRTVSKHSLAAEYSLLVLILP